jgi:hypothetical protein
MMTAPKPLPPVPPEEETDSDRDWERRHAGQSWADTAEDEARA